MAVHDNMTATRITSSSFLFPNAKVRKVLTRHDTYIKDSGAEEGNSEMSLATESNQS